MKYSEIVLGEENQREYFWIKFSEEGVAPFRLSLLPFIVVFVMNLVNKNAVWIKKKFRFVIIEVWSILTLEYRSEFLINRVLRKALLKMPHIAEEGSQ